MYFGQGSACCQWKRGKNDILCDNDADEKAYCATCWQEWIRCKRERTHRGSLQIKAKSPVSRTASTSKGTNRSSDVPDSTGENLQGVVHSDGKLYLLDKTKSLVYSMERNDDGDLIAVGVLQGEMIQLFDVTDPGQFPFAVEPADHCETPFVAYQDLSPLLDELSKLMKKKKEHLKIWDPYYCAGSVRKHFASLGFLSVHNVCEDFYQIIEKEQFPDYDCIITNPPYSTSPRDHVAELVAFLTNQDKPWFLLVPNYVYTKPFWGKQTTISRNTPLPFFLTPSTPRKYIYQTPEGARKVKSQRRRTSPFVSMWYCWTGPVYTSQLYKWIATSSPENMPELTIACSEYFLPDAFKDSNDSSRKKKRKHLGSASAKKRRAI